MSNDSGDPNEPRSAALTQLLNLVADGDAKRREDLIATVYGELRALAARHLAGERPGHTLQATALVHEAYLRLLGSAEPEWDSRRHFYSSAAQAMRRILIEHARKRGRIKRGGGWRSISLDGLDLAAAENPGGFVVLDEAIGRLEAVDARAAEIVHLRFYAGLDVDQTAAAMGLSRRTVLRDWSFARAWLYEALENPPDEPTA